jgi:VIT1/CCC1 family predicted Fe2+/Mn2+ transporter
MAYLKASLMGGVDGVITSFAVVAGASLMPEATSTVAVVGFSSVVADGLSMGISEYLSSTSERALTTRRGSPAGLGAVCFLSFVLCGTVPLVVFLGARQKLLACAAFALVELMLLGAGQAVLTREPLIVGLGRAAALGTLAGAAAYGVAYVAHAAE